MLQSRQIRRLPKSCMDGFLVFRAFVVLCLLSAALSATAQTTNEHYRRAILEIQQHIEQNDLEGARMLTHKAQTVFPNNGGLENLLGVIEIQQGHSNIAVQQFSAAIRHDPSLLSAYLNLGRVYMLSAESDTNARASRSRYV